MELTLCPSELVRVGQDVEKARLRAERAQDQLAAAATSRAEAEAESARLAEELAQLRGSIQAEQNELAAGGAELSAMNERPSAAGGGGAPVTQKGAEMGGRAAGPRAQATSGQQKGATPGEQRRRNCP